MGRAVIGSFRLFIAIGGRSMATGILAGTYFDVWGWASLLMSMGERVSRLGLWKRSLRW